MNDMKRQHHTIFSVEANLHPPLLCSQQSFSHLGHRRPLGVRSIQKATGAGLLHHLGSGVTAHPTEGVITEDDCTVFHLRVGDDELSICGWKGKKEAQTLTRNKTLIP